MNAKSRWIQNDWSGDADEPTPEWASEMVREVLGERQGLPSIKWYHDADWECGMCHFWDSLPWLSIVSKTTDRTDDNCMVLLHELAHVILGPPRRSVKRYHTPDFWDVCIPLYERHGLLEHAAKHESYAGGRKRAAKRLAEAKEVA